MEIVQQWHKDLPSADLKSCSFQQKAIRMVWERKLKFSLSRQIFDLDDQILDVRILQAVYRNVFHVLGVVLQHSTLESGSVARSFLQAFSEPGSGDENSPFSKAFSGQYFFFARPVSINWICGSKDKVWWFGENTGKFELFFFFRTKQNRRWKKQQHHIVQTTVCLLHGYRITWKAAYDDANLIQCLKVNSLKPIFLREWVHEVVQQLFLKSTTACEPFAHDIPKLVQQCNRCGFPEWGKNFSSYNCVNCRRYDGRVRWVVPARDGSGYCARLYRVLFPPKWAQDDDVDASALQWGRHHRHLVPHLQLIPQPPSLVN